MPKLKRGTVIGITAGGAGVAGFLIWQQHKKSAAAAAATAQAQAASSYGYGMANSNAPYGYGYYGYGEPGQGYYGYGSPYPPGGYYGYGPQIFPPNPNPTNAQWVQAAITQLSGDGYDSQSVAAALGAYVVGQPVTHQQESIIQAAIGIEGYPPQPGANGYPPAIHVQGQHHVGNVSVPNVRGKRADDARQILRQAGLDYNISDHATGVVISESPRAGTTVKRDTKVNLRVSGKKK